MLSSQRACHSQLNPKAATSGLLVGATGAGKPASTHQGSPRSGGVPGPLGSCPTSACSPCHLSPASWAERWARAVTKHWAGLWQAWCSSSRLTSQLGSLGSVVIRKAHDATGQKGDMFKKLLFLSLQQSEKYFKITDGAYIQRVLSSPVFFCTKPNLSPLLPSYHI